MYLMDQTSVAANSGVRLHAGRPPIVVMTYRAATRMRAFVMMSPIEVAGFGLLEHKTGQDSNGSDRLVVNDIHIMQQDCTAGSADITPQGFFELQDRLEKKYGRIMDRELRVWWHSHAKIGIGWSGTDTGTMSKYTEDVDLLCLLTNREAANFDANLFADKTLACYVSGPPARVAWDGLFIGIEQPKEGESTEKILQEAIEDFHGSIRNLPQEVKPRVQDGKLVVDYSPLEVSEKPETVVVPLPEAKEKVDPFVPETSTTGPPLEGPAASATSEDGDAEGEDSRVPA